MLHANRTDIANRDIPSQAKTMKNHPVVIQVSFLSPVGYSEYGPNIPTIDHHPRQSHERGQQDHVLKFR
jgi:hypothetical protein